MPALLLWIGTALIAAGPAPESSWWDSQVEASLDRVPAEKANGSVSSNRARPSIVPAWLTC